MAAPTITSFSPGSSIPGKKVTINGTNFSTATAVKFGLVDAFNFNIISSTKIEAYPDLGGTGSVSVTNPNGTATAGDFTLIPNRVQMPDSPALGRSLLPDDLLWLWDSVANGLRKITASQLPTGGGGGGGGFDTALGSPFKVRVGDDNMVFDGTDTIITDPRLLGKADYVVGANDIPTQSFRNFINPADGAGDTTADDGVVTDQATVNITGTGTGARFSVTTKGNAAVVVRQTALGSGYTIGDTFSIAALPGIVFTLNTLTGDYGYLIYDEDAGSVTIANYQLTDGWDIEIYADGVVSASMQAYLISQKANFEAVMLAMGPLLVNGGIIWAWRKTADLIPAGWQQCTDFNGKIPIGADPTDVYDADTNPFGLSQPVGTLVGGKTTTLVKENLPSDGGALARKTDEEAAGFGLSTNNGGFRDRVLVSAGSHGPGDEVLPLNGNDQPFSIIPPTRIVIWIEYIGV